MTPTTLALLSVLLGGGWFLIHRYKNREQFVPMSKVPERFAKLPKIECGTKKRF